MNTLDILQFAKHLVQQDLKIGIRLDNALTRVETSLHLLLRANRIEYGPGDVERMANMLRNMKDVEKSAPYPGRERPYRVVYDE